MSNHMCACVETEHLKRWKRWKRLKMLIKCQMQQNKRLHFKNVLLS